MKVSLLASDNLFLSSPRPRRRPPPRGRLGESPSRVSRCTWTEKCAGWLCVGVFVWALCSLARPGEVILRRTPLFCVHLNGDKARLRSLNNTEFIVVTVKINVLLRSPAKTKVYKGRQ